MFKKYLNIIVLLLLALVLSYIWFKDSLIMGSGESGLTFYNLQKSYIVFGSSWSTLFLGFENGIQVASIPTNRFLFLLEEIGVPNYLVEAIFFWIILSSGLISTYLLIKTIFPKIANIYSLLGSIFYLTSPISLVNIWSRFLYNYMVFWALFPTALLLFLKGIKKKDLRFSVLMSLSTVVFSFALTSMVFNILLWFTISYTALFFIIFKNKRRLFIIKFYLISLISFLLFNTWWLNQLFNFVLSENFAVTVDEFFDMQGNISTLTAISQRLGLLIDVMRGFHFSFYSADLPWSTIFYSPVFIFLGFVPICMVLWILFKFRKKLNILYLGSLLFISIFLMKGNNSPFGEIFLNIFKSSSIFQVFRNPFEKFGFLYLISFVVLFAFSLDYFSKKLKSRRSLYYFLISSFVIVAVVFGFPYWTGLVFTKTIGNTLVDYKIEVPDYYRKVNKWISDNNPENARFISLPLYGEGISYNWEKTYSGVELSSILFDTSNISFNTTIPYFNNIVSQIEANQLSTDIFKIIPFTNAKYIVVRSDIDYKERRMANPLTVKSRIRTWEDGGYIKKVYEARYLEVYEIDPKWYWPKLYLADYLVLTNKFDIKAIADFIPEPSNEKSVIVNLQKRSKDFGYQKLAIFPERNYVQEVKYPTPKDMTEDDLLSRLFHAEHLPNKWYYPVIRVKEFFEEISQTDYEGWLLYKTGILGKRAAEIYKLRKSDAQKNVVKNAERDYRRLLKNMTNVFIGTSKNETPVSDVVRNSLLYQWILFDRSGSPESARLSDLLIQWGVKTEFELPVSKDTYFVSRFDVPFSDDYNIAFHKQSNILDYEILVNGNKSESKTHLDSGKNEVAIVIVNKDNHKYLISEDELHVNNDNLPNWKIDVPDNQVNYFLEFEYRFVKGNSYIINLYQDVDREKDPVFIDYVDKNPKYHGWESYRVHFSTTPGADWGELGIKAANEKICKIEFMLFKKCVENIADIELEIRNLRLSIEDPPNVYLTLDSNQEESNGSTLSWNEISPTHYNLEIHKTDDAFETVVFSELYNSGWKVKYSDGTVIDPEKHLLVNAYANGWRIDKKGDYSLDINFAPQELLVVGGKITMVSIFAGLLYLGLSSWRKRIN